MCVNGDGCVEEKKGKTKEEADGQHQGQLEREKDKEEKTGCLEATGQQHLSHIKV